MSARVAIATCAGEDVDPDSPLVLAALRELGVVPSLVVWNDPSVPWDDFDLTVVRSTWDYTDHYEDFLAWTTRVPRLLNPPAIMRWSSDKRYLGELARAGVDVVPTTFVAPHETPVWPSGDMVVKPSVGAGSRGAERFTFTQRDRAEVHMTSLHDAGRVAMIQPYVASVDDEGEFAVIFIDGQLAHVMNKAAMLNAREMDRTRLYLIESMTPDEPREGLLEAANRVLAAAGASDLLYARVDLVRSGDTWLLMELELVEPSLFLTHRPQIAHTLAGAIVARLGTLSSPGLA